MNERLTWLRLAAFATSAGVHAAAYASLQFAPPAPTIGYGPTAVDFEVVGSQLPQPLPDSPEPQPEPEPPLPAQPRAAPEPSPQQREPPPAAATPDPEPVDLSGVTLTNDGSGSSWSSVVGNGSSMQGPIRRPTARQQRDTVAPAAAANSAARLRRSAPKPKRPSVVPVADLSRRPRPPQLNGVLLRNYPAEAKRSGRAGVAVVAARIEADGRIRVVSIVSESAAGFGQACVRTLIGSTWTPPLDQSGRAVATRISYTCRFQVTR